MMNQTIGPGSTGDGLYFMRVLLFIALLSTGYVISRPRPVASKERDLLSANTAALSSQSQEWMGLPPWQRRASEKAARKYAEVQGRKWRNWNEAMFERI